MAETIIQVKDVFHKLPWQIICHFHTATAFGHGPNVYLFSVFEA